MSSVTTSDASTAASASRLRAFFGSWRKATEPSPHVCNSTDDKLPPMIGKHESAQPSAACRGAPTDSNNLAAEFFGASETNCTGKVYGPPPYAPFGHEVIETQPAVYAVEEPQTLARMLFLYGFLFFPFWLVGISILFIPLSPTEDWESGKSEVEKIKLLHFHRDTEKKWARRCLIAMSSFTAVVLLLVIIIKYGIMASV